MTRVPKVAHLDDDLLSALKLFVAHGVDVLPVVAGEDDKGALFAGMLERRTIAGALLRRAESERAQLLREHADLRALGAERDLDAILDALPAARRRTVERVPVPADAAGRSLREADFRRRYGLEVVAIDTPAGEIITPPDPARPLAAGETLIALPTSPEGAATEKSCEPLQPGAPEGFSSGSSGRRASGTLRERPAPASRDEPDASQPVAPTSSATPCSGLGRRRWEEAGRPHPKNMTRDALERSARRKLHRRSVEKPLTCCVCGCERCETCPRLGLGLTSPRRASRCGAGRRRCIRFRRRCATPPRPRRR